MKITMNWKKMLTIMVDILLAAYLLVAVTAFNKPDKTSWVCTKVNISITDEATNGFIKTTEIKKRLEAARLYPLNKPMNDIDTRKIEETLMSSPFVQTAECYKAQNGQVSICISQRMPIVHIKAQNGDDYYLDDNNSIMPNSQYTSDLIVATGNISRSFAVNNISSLTKSIMRSELWKNQIEQINVLPDYGIELIPRVGEHIIYIGQVPEGKQRKDADKTIDEFTTKKLDRLEKFYRYGLSQAGWNKYSRINLEFDNQIICKKRKSAK